VLLHGGSVDRRLWAPQFERLARAGYRVIRYDIRPFGRSSAATEPYSDVADLRQLLDTLEVEKATLVGLSLGGRIAIDFALTHSARVDRIVLVGAGVTGFQFSGEAERSATYRAAYERGGIHEIVEQWLRDAYMAPAMEHAELAGELRMIAHENGQTWLRASRPYSSSELDPPAIDRLAEIQAETLIGIGERDVPDIHTIGRILEKRIPHSLHVTIAGAGHIVNMEAPEEFNQALFAFLREAR
jgi:pimeloyl-ACP methyl ester carboxylesterase